MIVITQNPMAQLEFAMYLHIRSRKVTIIFLQNAMPSIAFDSEKMLANHHAALALHIYSSFKFRPIRYVVRRLLTCMLASKTYGITGQV